MMISDGGNNWLDISGPIHLQAGDPMRPMLKETREKLSFPFGDPELNYLPPALPSRKWPTCRATLLYSTSAPHSAKSMVQHRDACDNIV